MITHLGFGRLPGEIGFVEGVQEGLEQIGGASAPAGEGDDAGREEVDQRLVGEMAHQDGLADATGSNELDRLLRLQGGIDGGFFGRAIQQIGKGARLEQHGARAQFGACLFPRRGDVDHAAVDRHLQNMLTDRDLAADVSLDIGVDASGLNWL